MTTEEGRTLLDRVALVLIAAAWIGIVAIEVIKTLA